MFTQTASYNAARIAGYRPIYLVFLTTNQTRRCFSTIMPTEAIMGTEGGIGYFDGSRTVGDGGVFGATPVSSWGARILRFGSLRHTLTPQPQNLLASLAQTEIGSMSFECDNTDGYFSTLLGDDRTEAWLTAKVKVYQGFTGCVFNDFQPVYAGEISELILSATTLRIVSEAV